METLALIGTHGKWATNEEGVRVVFEKTWRDSCDLIDENRVSQKPIELDCILIEKNNRLPVATLACQLRTPDRFIDEISLILCDSPQSGPFTLQSEPRRRNGDVPGSRWLLMGTELGLHVRSEDGRRALSPGITFTAEAVAFVEKDFIRKPAGK